MYCVVGGGGEREVRVCPGGALENQLSFRWLTSKPRAVCHWCPEARVGTSWFFKVYYSNQLICGQLAIVFTSIQPLLRILGFVTTCTYR